MNHEQLIRQFANDYGTKGLYINDDNLAEEINCMGMWYDDSAYLAFIYAEYRKLWCLLPNGNRRLYDIRFGIEQIAPFSIEWTKTIAHAKVIFSKEAEQHMAVDWKE